MSHVFVSSFVIVIVSILYFSIHQSKACVRTNAHGEIPCPDLTVANGEVVLSPDTDSPFAGTVATLTCDPGFDPQGTRRIVCLADGLWSGTLGTCGGGGTTVGTTATTVATTTTAGCPDVATLVLPTDQYPGLFQPFITQGGSVTLVNGMVACDCQPTTKAFCFASLATFAFGNGGPETRAYTEVEPTATGVLSSPPVSCVDGAYVAEASGTNPGGPFDQVICVSSDIMPPGKK